MYIQNLLQTSGELFLTEEPMHATESSKIHWVVAIALAADCDWQEPENNVRLRRSRVGFWTALTLMTALTGLTADPVDEVDLVGWLTSLALSRQ